MQQKAFIYYYFHYESKVILCPLSKESQEEEEVSVKELEMNFCNPHRQSSYVVYNSRPLCTSSLPHKIAFYWM